MSRELTPKQAESIRRKQAILSAGEGGYTPTPHSLYRTKIDDMGAKYGKTNARDALSIYALLCADINGEADKATYTWAVLTGKHIAAKRGVARERDKRVFERTDGEEV